MHTWTKIRHKLEEDSAFFAEKADALGVPKKTYTSGAFENADIVVDCLLGTDLTCTARASAR